MSYHRAWRPFGGFAWGLLSLSLFLCTSALPAGEPELQEAFVFGALQPVCSTASAPGVNYTVVDQGAAPLSVAYPNEDIVLAAGQTYPDLDRNWGFEIVYSNTTIVNDPALPVALTTYNVGDWNIYGPFDNTPNGDRAEFPDTCPEEIYDSFIGPKNWLSACDWTVVGKACDPCTVGGRTPDGIIFHVDVPNGFYRFVGAFGSANNNHAHRIIAEDGGAGPPSQLGQNHVVLVSNFDQAQYGIGRTDNAQKGNGVFARVGFDDKLPPVGDGVNPEPAFVNMDERGWDSCLPANSPVLEVTQGYIRFHGLQANANSGPGGPRDATGNGGNFVVLELWRFAAKPTVTPTAPTPSLFRSINPTNHAPGATLTVTLQANHVGGAATLVETVPDGFTITDAGGGTQAGNQLTFDFSTDTEITYTVKAKDWCGPNTFSATIDVAGAPCKPVYTTSTVCDPGACGIQSSGGVRDFLVIGPIDAGRDVNAAGNCSDNATAAAFEAADYITDGVLGETSILVEAGDVVEPDWGGAAAGLGVKVTPNTLVNPGGALTVWSARADANGYVNFNNQGYFQVQGTAGDPNIDDVIVYAVSYLENTTGSCLPAVIEVEADDAYKMLLNGEVVQVDATCGGVPGYGLGDRVPVILLPGTNIVTIALVENGGGVGVRLVLRKLDDTPLNDGSVRGTCIPPIAYPSPDAKVTRTLGPSFLNVPGTGTLTVTLEAVDISSPTTIVDTFPAELEVVDAGGGTVAGNEITFSLSAAGSRAYTLRLPGAPDECPFLSVAFRGRVSPQSGCEGNIEGDSTLGCFTTTCPATPDSEKAQLVEAFIFGGLQPQCPTFSVPERTYTVVDQVANQPLSISYPDPEVQLAAGQVFPDPDRTWGYEILYSNTTVVDDPDLPLAPAYVDLGDWVIYGPMDNSPNGDRNEFPDTCFEEIYDSFIGAKGFLSLCDQTIVGDATSPCTEGGLDPDGVIFRVDVPNGKYRFVLAGGSANNNHTHRFVAEDGGVGPPAEIGPNHVVLVSNFDQAQYDIGTTDNANKGNGVFCQVGFGDKIPPPGDGAAPSPAFVPMDEDGLPTDGCPSSPILDVTEGYVRIHCLQGNANAGLGGPRDANGGNLVVLELWKVEGSGPATPAFLRGDVDASGPPANITDGIYILNYLFTGGPAPPCLDAADTDNSGTHNITDGIYILNYLFTGGPAPPPPLDECGLEEPGDPTPPMGCAEYKPCQ